MEQKDKKVEEEKWKKDEEEGGKGEERGEVEKKRKIGLKKGGGARPKDVIPKCNSVALKLQLLLPLNFKGLHPTLMRETITHGS